MTDIREFMGRAPTHCTVCGARWTEGCKPPCINATAQAPPCVRCGEYLETGPWGFTDCPACNPDLARG